MTPTTFHQPSVPVVQTREQLEAVLENIAQMRRDHDELWREREKEIAAVREKYQPSLSDTERCLDLETSWAETWARNHPEFFGADRSLTCGQVTISFRAEPPRIERASRRWNWSRIAATLAETGWGKRYLRTPPSEVDKEAIAADLATLSPVELRNAGLKIIQGERFVLTIHNETAWQEAA